MFTILYFFKANAPLAPPVIFSNLPHSTCASLTPYATFYNLSDFTICKIMSHIRVSQSH